MLKMTFACLMALSITACSGKGTTGANNSGQGDSGALSVSATFKPDPPAQGSDTITISVKDNFGNPVRGAVVKIGTNMPSMSMKGPDLTAKDNGDGTYTSTAKLNYSTKWSFKIAADADGRHGSTTIDKDVQ